MRLDWSAIDWEDKIITVRNWKGGKTRSARHRFVNMSANLMAWLSATSLEIFVISCQFSYLAHLRQYLFDSVFADKHLSRSFANCL